METTSKGVEHLCGMLDRNETVTLVDVCATFDVDSSCAFEIMETLSELESVNALAVVRVKMANDAAPVYTYVLYDINNKRKQYHLDLTNDNNPATSVKFLGIVSLSRLPFDKMITSPLELISDCYADIDGDNRWKTRVHDVFTAATRGRTRKVLSIYKHQIHGAVLSDDRKSSEATANENVPDVSTHAGHHGYAVASYASRPNEIEEPAAPHVERRPGPASPVECPALPSVENLALNSRAATPANKATASTKGKVSVNNPAAKRKLPKKSKQDKSTTMTASINVLKNLIGDDESDAGEESDEGVTRETSRALDDKRSNEQVQRRAERKLSHDAAATASLVESDFFKNFTGDDDDDESHAEVNVAARKTGAMLPSKPVKKAPRRRKRKESGDRKHADGDIDMPDALENNHVSEGDADQGQETITKATISTVSHNQPLPTTNVKVVKMESKREVVKDENGFFVSRIVVESSEVAMAENLPVSPESDEQRNVFGNNEETPEMARVDKRTPVQPARKKAKLSDGFKQQSLTMFFKAK